MSKINSIADMKGEIAAARRALHENPQTCYEETFASNLVAEKLESWGIEFDRGLAITGIVAKIEGQKNTSGKAIGLRADMDALDIIETSGQPWASKTPGKMHGCGHDGHTAMLLGAAKYLSETRNFDGTVYLIFQPAEEGGGGAIRMIEEGLFDRYPIDEVYGLHNWPGLPRGKIALNPGPIMASTDDFIITLTGRGGHAAMPHLSLDPIPAACQIVTALQTLVSRTVDPLDQAVVSVTNMNGGTGASNVIPDTIKLVGTFRTFRPETREMLRNRIEEISTSIAKTFHLSIDFELDKGYDPTVNHAGQAALCTQVSEELVGAENVNANIDPCMGAEDFGAMLQAKPGCYIWMGQAEPDKADSPHNKGLHNAGYDFNDEIIPLGVEYWARLTETALPLDK